MNAAIRFSIREHLSIVDDYRKGKTLQQIGDERGYSVKRVQVFLEDAGEPRRSKGARGTKKMRTPVPPKKQKGLSKATSPKLAFFGTMIGDHMYTRSWGKKTYYHFDANAGDGQSPNGWRGTPRQFLDQVRRPGRQDLPVKARFVDTNAQAVRKLKIMFNTTYKKNENESRTFEFLCEDNSVSLSKFVTNEIEDPATAIGSIILDPYGVSEDGGAVDLAVLTDVCRRWPNAMLTIFHPYAAANRNRAYGLKHRPGAWPTRTLADYLALRPHWLISEPVDGKVFLCGSATKKRDVQKKGMTRAWHLDSEKGRAIVEHCDTIRGTHASPNRTSLQALRKILD